MDEKSSNSEEKTNLEARFKRLFDKNKIAIIPLGLMPTISGRIEKKLGIKLSHCPFAGTIASPDAISKSFKTYLNEDHTFQESDYEVCSVEKTENLISISTETYDSIDKKLPSATEEELKNYISSTHSYYTRNINTGIVHLRGNWHAIAADKNPKHAFNPSENLADLSAKISKKLKRVQFLSKKANVTFFVYDCPPKMTSLKINNSEKSLTDHSVLQADLNSLFGSKVKLVKFREINHLRKIMKFYREINLPTETEDSHSR